MPSRSIVRVMPKQRTTSQMNADAYAQAREVARSDTRPTEAIRKASVRALPKDKRHADENAHMMALMEHGYRFGQMPKAQRISMSIDGSRVASVRVIRLFVPEDSALAKAFTKLERAQSAATKKGLKVPK